MAPIRRWFSCGSRAHVGSSGPQPHWGERDTSPDDEIMLSVLEHSEHVTSVRGGNHRVAVALEGLAYLFPELVWWVSSMIMMRVLSGIYGQF